MKLKHAVGAVLGVIANLGIGIWCLVDPLLPFSKTMGVINVIAGVALLAYVLWDLWERGLE